MRTGRDPSTDRTADLYLFQTNTGLSSTYHTRFTALSFSVPDAISTVTCSTRALVA
jgi:hypothetical protein